MINKIIELLKKAINEPSEKAISESIEFLFDNVTNYELDEIYKQKKLHHFFNFQTELFYKLIADELRTDLNEYTETYFSMWEVFLLIFDNDKKEKIFNYIKNDKEHTNAVDYINGFSEFDNGSSEIALFHFNQIDNYVACYFIALCYMLNENFENSIKNNLTFIKELEKTIEKSKTDEFNLADDIGILVAEANVYGDLGYCYTRIKEFEKAVNYFEKSIEIVDLETRFNSYYQKSDTEESVDEFTIFFNNYLFALDKSGESKKCLKLLNFITEKLPSNYYYKSQKNRVEAKIKNNAYADDIIKQVFKPKKAFNIGSFEQTKLISKEKVLEDMIMEQIKYGFQVFNKDLEVYQDEKIYGRQYYIASVNGFLDLLLIDPKTDIVYVVELKRNEAGAEVVEQTEKYIFGLQKEIDKEIRGIICLHNPKGELIDLVNQKDKIELFTYNFEFTKVKKK